jgi:glycosyltransferase involved in cell wall biosynthesis
MWKALPRLIRYLRKNSPSVIISAEQTSNFIALWSKILSLSDTKFVITVHENMSEYVQNVPFWYRRFIPFLIRAFYPIADEIIAVSEGIGEDLLSFSKRLKSKITAIYNPVIDDSITPKSNQPIEHPWLNNNEIPVILAVGRLSPEKNYSLLLRAFAIVLEERDVRMVLLGDGTQRDVLEKLAVELDIDDKIDFQGFVSNPYSFMSNASVFVLSSIFEGLPTALIESLACGCPVVSTNCHSGPDEILEGGKWGKLVQINDESAMASAILETLSEKQDVSQLRTRAQDFTVQKSVDQYLEVLFDQEKNHAKIL